MKSLPRVLAALPIGWIRRRVFVWALEQGEQDLALRLLERLDRVDFDDSMGFPIEFLVAGRGNLEILQRLFDKRPDLDASSRLRGKSFLHFAARSGSTECVRWLLDRGADPTAEDGGETPLHWAAGSSLEATRVLVAARADVDAGHGRAGTPLGSAGYMPEIAGFLLEQGADPDAPDAVGRTPLMKARHAAVAEALLAAGADVHRTDKEGRDAVSHAAHHGAEVIPVLVEAGADVRRRDAAGYTPLGRALCSHSQEYPEEVRTLLAHGADVEEEIWQGQSPLAVACLSAQLPVIRILLDAGADPNATTDTGKSVLDLVRETDKPSYMRGRFKEVERMLVAAGARPG